MNEEKGIVLKKLVKRVGDGCTFIVEDAPTREQVQRFEDAVDQLAAAFNSFNEVMRPVVEQFLNDVAPIIANLEGYDSVAEARARSKADVAAKRREMRRRKGRV